MLFHSHFPGCEIAAEKSFPSSLVAMNERAIVVGGIREERLKMNIKCLEDALEGEKQSEQHVLVRVMKLSLITCC
jgi:hypothetical protein